MVSHDFVSGFLSKLICVICFEWASEDTCSVAECALCKEEVVGSEILSVLMSETLWVACKTYRFRLVCLTSRQHVVAQLVNTDGTISLCNTSVMIKVWFIPIDIQIKI